MRYLPILLVCAAIMGRNEACCAQNAQQAIGTYERCVKAQESQDRGEIAESLYECYKANLSLLQTAMTGSQDYNLAHGNLLNIWPYLGFAASHFSSVKKDMEKAVYLSEAYVNMPLMPAFRGNDFNYQHRAQIVIFIATHYYNRRLYDKAIKYLELYLRVGDDSRKKDVQMSLISAYAAQKQTQQALQLLDEVIQNDTENFDLILNAIALCQELNEIDAMQIYLDKALTMQPQNESLLSIQAQLDSDKAKQYEAQGEYAKAALLYSKMYEQDPENPVWVKHLTLNRYNLGAMYAQEAAEEENSKTKKNLIKLSKAQFADAQSLLIDITKNDPTSVVFNIALATVYAQLGQVNELKAVNKNLSSMGIATVDAKDTPRVMDLSGNSVRNYLAQNSGATNLTANGEVPRFSAFAKEAIESEIRNWQLKDPYETVTEHKARVNDSTRNAKVEELKKKAESDYIKAYATKLTPASFKLRPYDAENGVFLLEGGDMGNLVLPVPRANNEARLFERNWKEVVLTDPKYRIVDDHLALAALTFVTPAGQSYQYKSDKILSYTETQVDINFEAIDYAQLANASGGKPVTVTQQKVTVGRSDVDIDIPGGAPRAENTFALIIANEKYKRIQEAGEVPFAEHDGEIFSEYCKETLGIPEEQIITLTNATLSEMNYGVSTLVAMLERVPDGMGKAIVYYSGHGVPSEDTRFAYLLPVDGFTADVNNFGYPLSKLYKNLAEVPSQGVTVFLDACFSGMSREGGSMSSGARGAAIKPKKEDPTGKLVVISAASGTQTAWPYKAQQHGLFTYYLLKKLKETAGDVNLGELSSYIKNNVTRQSLKINKKEQTPSVDFPEHLAEEWQEWKLTGK